MKIIDRWNEFMGPKDERLTAEANRCAAVGYAILIIGSALCLYYGIMLNQVAETTGHPLLTPLGQSVFPVDTALLIIILASGLISTYLQVRSGTFDTHTRIAQSDRIPWDYVALVSLLCGLGLGVTTTVLRILAEVQIVGVENVTWGGDIAMGIVYFTLAFFLAFGLFAVAQHAVNLVVLVIQPHGQSHPHGDGQPLTQGSGAGFYAGSFQAVRVALQMAVNLAQIGQVFLREEA